MGKSKSIHTFVVTSPSPPPSRFTEANKKAFDFASETTKQLLTLSTGIVALTITFAKDILIAVPFSAKLFLMAAWGVYVVSLLFGISTLMALAGELEPPPTEANEAGSEADANVNTNDNDIQNASDNRVPSIWAKSIKLASTVQVITFLVATSFVVVSGVLSTVNSNRLQPTAQPEPALKIVQRDLFEALLLKDLAALASVCADEFLFVDEFGQLHNKVETLVGIERGTLSYEQISVSDTNIQVIGNTAIKSGRVAVKAKHRGEETNGDYRFMLAFVNRQERWQVLAMQLSPVIVTPAQAAKKTTTDPVP